MPKYTAFISYSNASKSAAINLHKALESYVVPKALRGRQTDEVIIGKSLGVFCVDRAELSATPRLEEEIQGALSDSKFLIVLCTPRAAESIWVRLEIEFFKGLGRKKHILPVLLDGEPEVFDSQTSPQGAFPHALFDKDFGEKDVPLAPDMRDQSTGKGDGFEVAFLRIVARLLGVRFPEMTQRHLVAEKQKRQLRNRIITALSVMLVLTVTGGTLAWNQKQAADKRLAQALQTASKQVHLAKEFRPRYGIQSSVSLELFSSASEEFDTIASEAGKSPVLLLNRARYALGMADLVADVEGSERSSLSFLQDASRDIKAAQAMSEKWYTKHWFHDVPEVTQILREEVNALDLLSRYWAVGQSGDEALQLAEQAVELSKKLNVVGYTAEKDPQDLVFSVCALADIEYAIGRRLQSEATYAECLDAAETLWESQPTPGARSIFVNALIDYGMILRLDPSQVGEAKKLHRRAIEMARAEHKNARLSDDDYLLLANALVSYADTVNLAAGALEVQLINYQRAGEILTDLIATDLNRKDWKTLRSVALYREAGIYARQAIALDQLSLLEVSERKFTEGIEFLQPLAQRFDDDIDLLRSLTAFYENRAEVNALRVMNAGNLELYPEINGDLDALIDLRKALLQKTQDSRNNKVFTRDLANAYLTRAGVELKLDLAPALIKPRLVEARKIFETLKSDPDFQPNIHRDLAFTHLQEAKLWDLLDNAQNSCSHARSAHDHMKQLQAASTGNTRNDRDSAYAEEQLLAYCDIKDEAK